jgi:hypothetical protein
MEPPPGCRQLLNADRFRSKTLFLSEATKFDPRAQPATPS